MRNDDAIHAIQSIVGRAAGRRDVHVDVYVSDADEFVIRLHNKKLGRSFRYSKVAIAREAISAALDGYEVRALIAHHAALALALLDGQPRPVFRIGTRSPKRYQFTKKAA